MQAQFLSALQDHAQIRVIAATNANLQHAVNIGAFREDLYYRLNVVQLKLPPLRERPEDIAALTHHFLHQHHEDTGAPMLDVSAAALALLQKQAWPGNIRQLQNVLLRSAFRAENGWLESKNLALDKNELLPDAVVSSVFSLAAEPETEASATPALRDLPVIMRIAREVMSPREYKCLEATHFVPHDQKRAPASLAADADINLAPQTVEELIQSAKVKLGKALRVQHPELAEHPVLRRRNFLDEDARVQNLPYLTAEEVDPSPAAQRLRDMASILLNPDGYVALTRCYLASAQAYRPAKDVGDMLGLTGSGVQVKANAARDLLVRCLAREPDGEDLHKHHMFTGKDRKFTQRKFAAVNKLETGLDLSTLSAQAAFEAANKYMKEQQLRPFLETHLRPAQDKPSLEDLARMLDCEPKTVGDNISEGKRMLFTGLEQAYPALLESPVLRRRAYTSSEEAHQDYSFFKEDLLDALSEQDRERLEWARLLLNRREFSLIGWAATLGDQSLHAAVKDTPQIQVITSYQALHQMISMFDKIYYRALEVETQLRREPVPAAIRGRQVAFH